MAVINAREYGSVKKVDSGSMVATPMALTLPARSRRPFGSAL
jgi:hypothetical protein